MCRGGEMFSNGRADTIVCHWLQAMLARAQRHAAAEAPPPGSGGALAVDAKREVEQKPMKLR